MQPRTNIHLSDLESRYYKIIELLQNIFDSSCASRLLEGTDDRVLTVQSEQARSAGDALIIRRAVAGLAGRVARRAIVILRFVRVGRTRGITLVLVHHQMMLAAGTLVRSVLAAGAIGLAWHARAVLGVCTERCNGRVNSTSVLGREKKIGREI